MKKIFNCFRRMENSSITNMMDTNIKIEVNSNKAELLLSYTKYPFYVLHPMYYPKQLKFGANTNFNIINYTKIMDITKLANLTILNTGREHIKNIKFKFKIEKEQAFLKECNEFWLNENKIYDFDINDMDKGWTNRETKYYVDEVELSNMRPQEEINLPVPWAINGVLTSTLFNFAYYASDEELSSKIKAYKQCFNETILNIKLTIIFESLDGGKYEKNYNLKFEIKAINFPSGITIGLFIEE